MPVENGATLRGGCACGQVKYQVPVEAVRFGFASCHCATCRAAHAAPFVMWTGISKEHAHRFELVSGADAVRGYPHRLAERYFCTRCGTHTHLVYGPGDSAWAGEVHLPTATLDEACIPALEAHVAALGRPRYLHVFYSDRAACLGELERWAAAPRFGGETGTEKLEG